MEFSVDSCIRGHHISKEFWTPSIDQQLFCEKEEGNPHDPYAVAVLGVDNTVLGHVPRQVSAGCFLFLQQNGRITCKVSGPRQFSADLPQGGLEVPCTLTFSGEVKLVEKMKKLILPSNRSAGVATAIPTSDQSPPVTDTLTSKEETGEISSTSTEMMAISHDCDDDNGASAGPLANHWLTHAGWTLTDQDRNAIVKGACLNDNHVNFAQTLLKHQFSNVGGLASTLQLSARKVSLKGVANVVQIIHARGNHWIVASTVSSKGRLHIFDTLYDTLDQQTDALLEYIFGKKMDLEMIKIPRQQGYRDCGVFAIAIATSVVAITGVS